MTLERNGLVFDIVYNIFGEWEVYLDGDYCSCLDTDGDVYAYCDALSKIKLGKV